MGGKKRSLKKSVKDTVKEVVTNKTEEKKKNQKEEEIKEMDNALETVANKTEDKKKNQKEEEIKEDNKDDTLDSSEPSQSNNTNSNSRRSSKRSVNTNNNTEETSLMPKRSRRAPPKDDGIKTTDNGKTKPKKSYTKEKPQGREYEVEAIMGKRKTKGSEEFLVKWKGYSEKDNSWVPKRNLNCKRLLDEFLKAKN